MRLGKSVLSQNLRTRCDLALYLTLFTDKEAKAAGLPTPLSARPGIGSLRDAGVEQEAAICNQLQQAFGPLCIGEPPRPGATSWGDQPLREQLQNAPSTPAFLVQSNFDVSAAHERVFLRLGVSEEAVPEMPSLGAFIPDLLLIDQSREGASELTATGERVQPGEGRLAISVIDIKHAQEANPSYEAEVSLYGVMLANWLLENGLSSEYYVSGALYLWTRAGMTNGAFVQALARGESNPQLLLDSIRAELDPINLAIYVPTIRRFFAERLPQIIAQGQTDWRKLDWHVGPACASCDWLGHEGWLSKVDKATIAQRPDDYCFSRAERSDHLSRLPLITKGSRRALESGGIRTISDVAKSSGTEPVFRDHTTLKAERRTIPAFAEAIRTGTTSTDAVRSDGMLAGYADLDVFINVNFDPGAGLLSGLGLQAYFRQHKPFEERDNEPMSRKWAEKWVVTSKTAQEERSVVLAFLQFLASICGHVTDPDPERGGSHAADTKAQVVFWDRRQYEELCRAIGRHLPAILYDKAQDRLTVALVWLFPPEEIQETDNFIEASRPAIAFTRETLRRLVRVPALHALTLFQVAQHYHSFETPFLPPDSYYSEPLSDTIPRERIYEIWWLAGAGQGRTLHWGSVIKTHSKLIEDFGKTIAKQGVALSTVTWRLRRDFRRRLRAEAPRLQLRVPTWGQGVAHDSKLWMAWARFESAFGKGLRQLMFSADPEEVEASHEGLRVLSATPRADGSGSFDCVISPESANTKLRPGQGQSLCLSYDAIPGFLSMPVSKILGYDALPSHLLRYVRTPMHQFFEIVLDTLDRGQNTASFRFSEWTRAEKEEVREMVMQALHAQLHEGVTILQGLGPDSTVKRMTEILRAIGNPSNALADPKTSAALGLAHRPSTGGRDPVTPAARVLWAAADLAGEEVRDPQSAAEVAARCQPIAKLDLSQAAAVSHAAERRLSIIWGPPGTGKTATCAGLVHGLVAQEAAAARTKPYAILLTGPTYKAVGELVGRLVEELAQDPAARCHIYGAYSPHRADRFPLPDAPPEHLSCAHVVAAANDTEFSDLVDEIDGGTAVIVVATVTHQCARIAEHVARLRHDEGRRLWPLFDFVLIDETSQVDMSTGVMPLALLKNDFQLVVAGDHLQMPPIMEAEPPVGAEHLVGSLQEYLTKRFDIDAQPLLKNYRSNADIVAYTKRLGYPPALEAAFPDTRLTLEQAEDLDSVLEAMGLARSDAWPLILNPDRPIVAVTYADGVSGQANPFEAECIASLVWLLRRLGTPKLQGRPGEAPASWDDVSFWEKGVGIVTPHRAQRAQVVRTLSRTFPDVDPNLIEEAVDTVERFQGGQRQTIMISLGVGDPDVIQGEERFLMQLERTNVAVSRAIAKCIVLISDEAAGHVPRDRKAAASAHALRGIVDEWCNQRSGYAVTLPDGSTRRIAARWRKQGRP